MQHLHSEDLEINLLGVRHMLDGDYLRLYYDEEKGTYRIYWGEMIDATWWNQDGSSRQGLGTAPSLGDVLDALNNVDAGILVIRRNVRITTHIVQDDIESLARYQIQPCQYKNTIESIEGYDYKEA